MLMLPRPMATDMNVLTMGIQDVVAASGVTVGLANVLATCSKAKDGGMNMDSNAERARLEANR